jgi:hypothetical protein
MPSAPHTKIRNALARAFQADPLWGSDFPGDQEDRPSAPLWDPLRLTKRRSVRQQADDVTAILGTVGAVIVPLRSGGQPLEIRPGELELLAEEEHERWMRTRAKGGWRRGQVKDSVKRTHPSMVPYRELSESERDKDRERILRLPAILERAGLGVDRP